MKRIVLGSLVVALFALLRPAPSLAAPPKTPAKPPNILFIMLDDVGIDQLHIFNPLSPTSPATPVLDQVAAKGVKFTKFYTMPECSPSRTAFFTGRYPLRTGVTAALLPEDLPAAQISPYEIATPKVLASAGYASAMLGKYHLGGPDNNPDGYRTPAVLGWDYYTGTLSGGPPEIDATLGGQYTADKAKYSCGFPIGAPKGGCWFQDGKSKARFDDNGGLGYDGRKCTELGGIAALNGATGDVTLTCGPNDHCKAPDFTKGNAYYVWDRVTTDGQAVHRSVTRKYMTTAQTDDSIDWIRKQAQGGRANRPWMATVSYNADHILYQPPPAGLYPPGAPTEIPTSCDTSDLVQQRVISNRMIEAMDKEIGRLLVSIGLAQQGPGGTIQYTPEGTNTMVVIAGDNGSFLPSVKYPYSLTRSKGSVYETGVLTPLIVAGPLVVGQGRTVDALTSCVDLFELFGEIAGLDVRSVVPAEHTLDSKPMLPYLQNPAQGGQRSHIFTQLGNGLKPPSLHIWPCVLSLGPQRICTDILFTTQSLCIAAGGHNYGPDSADENHGKSYDTCCDVAEADPPVDEPPTLIVPPRAWSIRNGSYKLVRVTRPVCDSDSPDELYKLAPKPFDLLNPLGLDNEDDNLFLNPLTSEAESNYAELKSALEAMLSSEVPCPGDGNLDKRVDQQDLVGVQTHMGEPSVFDFNADGVTDALDLAIVKANFGTDCRATLAANRP